MEVDTCCLCGGLNIVFFVSLTGKMHIRFGNPVVCLLATRNETQGVIFERLNGPTGINPAVLGGVSHMTTSAC